MAAKAGRPPWGSDGAEGFWPPAGLPAFDGAGEAKETDTFSIPEAPLKHWVSGEVSRPAPLASAWPTAAAGWSKAPAAGTAAWGTVPV